MQTPAPSRSSSPADEVTPFVIIEDDRCPTCGVAAANIPATEESSSSSESDLGSNSDEDQPTIPASPHEHRSDGQSGRHCGPRSHHHHDSAFPYACRGGGGRGRGGMRGHLFRPHLNRSKSYCHPEDHLHGHHHDHMKHHRRPVRDENASDAHEKKGHHRRHVRDENVSDAHEKKGQDHNGVGKHGKKSQRHFHHASKHPHSHACRCKNDQYGGGPYGNFTLFDPRGAFFMNDPRSAFFINDRCGPPPFSMGLGGPRGGRRGFGGAFGHHFGPKHLSPPFHDHPAPFDMAAGHFHQPNHGPGRHGSRIHRHHHHQDMFEPARHSHCA